LPLTYHGDSHNLRCHTCGFTTHTPTSCPECGATDIIFKTVGTKAVADEIGRIFPAARVMRFDTDNKKAERLEQHYDAVRKGEVDILVGTQLLAKGLDLPKLSTLGIVIADTSLSFPDFSSHERTYQLLSQVMGRIGRGHRAGRAIVQTYEPDRPVVRAALARDWNSFYTTEMTEREHYFFPPFTYLLKLGCRRASSDAAKRAAEDFAALLKRQTLTIRVEGPAPSFHEKIAGKYEWQLVIKSRTRSELLKVIKLLPASGWNYDIDPSTLL
jgi:primosomal protein N' (replication factor Y)